MQPHPLCRHLPVPAADLPGPDAYVSVFTGAFGETLVFVAHAGVAHARVLHAGAGFAAFDVVDGLAEGVCLDEHELAFVATCWNASRWYRHSDGTDAARTRAHMTAIHDEPRILVSLRAVAAYGVCAGCGERIGNDRHGEWYHADAAGRLHERGCRAASFRIHGDWNDRWGKTATARPR